LEYLRLHRDLGDAFSHRKCGYDCPRHIR
jgi:hypothetical protein